MTDCEAQKYIERMAADALRPIFLPAKLLGDSRCENIIQKRVVVEGPRQGRKDPNTNKFVPGQHNFKAQKDPKSFETIVGTKVMCRNIKAVPVDDEQKGELLLDDDVIVQSYGRTSTPLREARGWDRIGMICAIRAAKALKARERAQ